ncbi:MAG TPA: DUF3443 family protein [Terriglobales bacterium]|nr:DUF3443 family protein [Terriglobales bacterium]
MRKLVFVLILLGCLALAVGCGGGSSSSSSGGGSSSSGGSTSSAANVLSIVVDGGPTANEPGGVIYSNAAFATVTICAPGSSTNCATVDHLLVDTGSFGLRVLESEVASLNLPTVNASNGSAAYDCASFADGSFLWGPVQGATVTLAGETAANLPIQVVSSSTANIPSSCSTNLSEDQGSQSGLGANGILGVGLEPQDCGPACAPGGLSPPPPVYYTCSSSSCTLAYVDEANQVTNPVVLFSTDNNGVIVELPAISESAATVTGSLIFGIGTESNNQLASSATVFTTLCDDFTTIFKGTTLGPSVSNDECTGPGSFIDSGSNGLYFQNLTNIPLCPSSTPAGNLSGFYCPASLTNYSATNVDPNHPSTTKVTDFSVDNALNLFTGASTSSDAAFSTIGGLNPAGYGFDWGLPFFYGVNLYSAIDGQIVSSAPQSPPWWAY